MRSALFILLMFVALTSIVSGLLMISDPPGALLNLPLSTLQEFKLLRKRFRRQVACNLAGEGSLFVLITISN